MEETGEGEVVAEIGTREGGELVSSLEGGFVHDPFSESFFMRVVISECVKL